MSAEAFNDSFETIAERGETPVDEDIATVAGVPAAAAA